MQGNFLKHKISHHLVSSLWLTTLDRIQPFKSHNCEFINGLNIPSVEQ